MSAPACERPTVTRRIAERLSELRFLIECGESAGRASAAAGFPTLSAACRAAWRAGDPRLARLLEHQLEMDRRWGR